MAGGAGPGRGTAKGAGRDGLHRRRSAKGGGGAGQGERRTGAGAGWQPWRRKEAARRKAPPPHIAEAARATKEMLEAAGHSPKKALGQNFMLDDDVLRRVVQAAEVRTGDVVVEIGPGTGNLTSHLLEAGARVLAVEKDDTLVDVVRMRFADAIDDGRLSVLHNDVLHVDIEECAFAFANGDDVHAAAPPPERRWRGDGSANTDAEVDPAPERVAESARRPKANLTRTLALDRRAKVVANLPYNLTKDVLLRLLPMGGVMTDVVVMLQDEAARRWSEAAPGDADYRGVSVLASFFAEPSYAFFIPRNAFYPAPNVDSACVRFALRDPDLWAGASDTRLARVRALTRVVNAGFTSRRKMLRNTLQGGAFGDAAFVAAALASAGLDPDVRPQDVSAAGFARLVCALEAARP